MNVNIYELKELNDIHKFFRGFRAHGSTGWWFRGHADVDWKPVPKAGRAEFYLGPDRLSGKGRDLGRFNAWRKLAVAYVKDLPENDWECLAIAQHHGLATRLLDWSLNPLVAVFFAVVEKPDCDGAVFCYDPELFVKEKTQPIDFPGVGIGFVPRAVSPRILNQRCAFTYHSPPEAEIMLKLHYVWQDHFEFGKTDYQEGLQSRASTAPGRLRHKQCNTLPRPRWLVPRRQLGNQNNGNGQTTLQGGT